MRRPNLRQVEARLERCRDVPWSYDWPGWTRSGPTEPPAGFVVDHRRTELGRGDEVFQSAATAVRNWIQFDIGWMQVHPPQCQLAPGATVAVLARFFGLWWCNVCRIVYVVNDANRFGFAYGSLRGQHAASGEERFLIERLEDGRVVYDLLACSRPQTHLARIGRPLLRAVQKQFGRQSALRMHQAVSQ